MADIVLTEYTDPWCTWCWGSEPVLRHIDAVFPQVEITFVTGGLVKDWESFQDAQNNIYEPAQVAPHWEEASGRHGMPVDSSIWRDDPPYSTFPSNIAYHAAMLVDAETADTFLRRMREAAAAEAQNIAKEDVLVALAEEVGMDPAAFRDAFNGDEAREAFERDRADAEQHDALGFPTFHIESRNQEGWLKGYRPSDTFHEIFVDEIGIEPREPPAIDAFVAQHGRVATQEVAELRGISRDEAHELLAAREDVERVPAGNDAFWRPA